MVYKEWEGQLIILFPSQGFSLLIVLSDFSLCLLYGIAGLGRRISFGRRSLKSSVSAKDYLFFVHSIILYRKLFVKIDCYVILRDYPFVEYEMID